MPLPFRAAHFGKLRLDIACRNIGGQKFHAVNRHMERPVTVNDRQVIAFAVACRDRLSPSVLAYPKVFMNDQGAGDEVSKKDIAAGTFFTATRFMAYPK